MHIRYNETNDLWEWLSATGPDVWSKLPIDATQLTSGIPSLNGIKFPATQVDDSNVNTLDDYEEGSWTPRLGASTSESLQVHTGQFGEYTKIGRHVFFYGNLSWSTKGTLTGNVQIKGLPFTSKNSSARSTCHFGYFTGMANPISSLQGYIPQNGTAIQLTYILGTSAGGITMAVTADFSNSQDLIFSGHYSI